MTPQNYKTILITRRKRNYRMPAFVTIEEDRKKVVENATQLNGTVIYTDGSGFENNIGAAAVLVKNGTPIKKIRYQLGSNETHTVYEAEALAVVLALYTLCTRNKLLTNLTIGMDNQAVLLGIQNQKSKPGHYIIDKIHNALQDFQVSQARLRGKRIKGYKIGKGRTKLEDRSIGWKEWKVKQWCQVEFIWAPGHKGIEGNEIADEEAKLAAQGDSSMAKNLPPFL